MSSENDATPLYAVNSIIKFPSARDLALRHGPAIFREPAYRWVAAAVVSLLDGGNEAPASPPPALRAEVHAIVGALGGTEIPDTPEWAVYLVQTLIADAAGPILAAQLRWAASRLEDPVPPPLTWLKRRVDEAFVVALGQDVGTFVELLEVAA